MTAPTLIEELFLAALEKSPDERAAWLDQACGDDPELRNRVDRLLAAHPQARQFLEQPAGPVDEPTVHCHLAGETPGTVIAGRYKLLEQIGEGGMGAVWMAEQLQPVRRKVALKLIKLGMDSKLVTARFEAERQALALMDHPHIAKVLDGGMTETGRPYFVMEYVKGVPITEYCDSARLTVAERLQLFIPVCQAVQHAHQKGIVHRDLKPSNVLVCLYDGRPVPKVIDFGLAKALHQPLTEHTLYTAHGVIMGTPLYMSPEQAEQNNFDVDTRTDVYSLGVILYELLTGTTPLEKHRFKDAAWQEMLRLIKDEEPPRPSTRLTGSGSLPGIAAQRRMEPVKLTRLMRRDLDWVVMKCLEKERSRRYESAAGLARDLERYLGDEAVEACPPSTGYRLRKFVRRNKTRVAMTAALSAMAICLIAVVVGGVWWSERQAVARQYEQSLAAARHNELFASTLDKLEAALQADRLDEASALLGQLDKHASEQTLADLRNRQAQLRRDADMLRELRDIFEERWIASATDTGFDSERARVRYPQAFRKYGVDVAGTSAEDTVGRIRASVIAQALTSGMTEWFFVEPAVPGLLAVIDLLDPDSTRSKLRGAIVRNDDGQVKQLSQSIDATTLSPAFAIGLATHSAEVDPMQILQQAWTTHSDSFPLALTLSRLTFRSRYDEKDTGRHDALGWSRAALALQPRNPIAHYFYGLTLGECGDAHSAAAVAEFRRTIELAPRFAKAYSRMAFILTDQGRSPSAEAAQLARRALELDDSNLLAYLVLYSVSMSSEDYLQSADLFRRLQTLKQQPEPLGTGHMADDMVMGYADGYVMATFAPLVERLIATNHPQQAWGLLADFPTFKGFFFDSDVSDEALMQLLAARAAALLGTGDYGIAAAERPTRRQQALDKLTAALADLKQSLANPPEGKSPAENAQAVHDELDRWLTLKDLARVRDDEWLAKLPASEQEPWRELWMNVRALHNTTASAATDETTKEAGLGRQGE